MTTISPARERFFNADGQDAIRAVDLPTLAALEKFLGGMHMLVTCPQAERIRVTGGGHADVIIVRTNDAPRIPEPTWSSSHKELMWQGFGEVISLQPFLSLIVGSRRGGWRFMPHVGPNTAWCRIRFVQR